jgi:putative ABC transport system permease protein
LSSWESEHERLSLARRRGGQVAPAIPIDEIVEPVNFSLALFLAWRSLSHHPTITLATVLGVAIGMTVVGVILIVDRNSVETPIVARSATAFPNLPSGADDAPAQQILRLSVERANAMRLLHSSRSGFPTQEGKLRSGVVSEAPLARRGEEDYQAMRLAVRLASLLAFTIGAVIVFYTLRFSVASRSRELSLLLCLGEERRNVALSLLLEAALQGLAGTLTGLLIAFPAAFVLIDAGISTTGRMPASHLTLPVAELAAMTLLSAVICLLGAAGPARALYGMRIVEVLQPRFLSPGIDERNLRVTGFGWLMPPLMAAAYLALRPFLMSWLSVARFFALEVLFAGVLALAVLWWMTPLLRGVIRLAEWSLQPLLPLHTLLVGRRMRLTGRKLVFTVAAVTLVFSLLIALHDITRALKYEIQRWSREALLPYVFLQRNARHERDSDRGRSFAESPDFYLFRMSQKVTGELPFRLVAAADVNPYLDSKGRPNLGPGRVLVSRTLAARFALSPGDQLVIHTAEKDHRFVVTEVSDDLGFFADTGQYVDLKSYFLFSDGNPLFAGALEQTIGDFVAARKRGGGRFTPTDIADLRSGYHSPRDGWTFYAQQRREIDRDFLIFDFILIMTLLLAIIGVGNGILIQVLARQREFSVLRTMGISRAQTTVMLLVEGAIIGIVSAMLALVLGHTIGAISVSFLDRFTLFDYQVVFSTRSGVFFFLFAVATCCLAAVYPAVVANRISSAESLHYE